MWLRKILHTGDDYVLMLARVVLGIIFLAHGSQKVLGWFGGPGFDQTIKAFVQGMGIPAFLAVMAILAEFVGGIGLLVGLLSRIAAFGIAINMIVAVSLVHARNGLFMNWSGNQRGEGFEYHLLALAVAVLVLVRGAGAWSLDRVVGGLADRWPHCPYSHGAGTLALILPYFREQRPPIQRVSGEKNCRLNPPACIGSETASALPGIAKIFEKYVRNIVQNHNIVIKSDPFVLIPALLARSCFKLPKNQLPVTGMAELVSFPIRRFARPL